MPTNISRYKGDFKKLIQLGKQMSMDVGFRIAEREGCLNKELIEIKKKNKITFEDSYQRWYSEATSIIRQLMPDRLKEFEMLYMVDPKRKILNATSYKIQDWLIGYRAQVNFVTGKKTFDDLANVSSRIHLQFQILESIEARFDSSLFDILQLAQADLYDTELEGSADLLKKGFLRGAGVIAGVILEKHLSHVCTNHKIVIHKKDPTISDFNELLKKNNTIDVPNWRFIQRLGDLRNLCGHNKDREPTKEEVSELIDGVGKILKTLF